MLTHVFGVRCVRVYTAALAINYRAYASFNDPRAVYTNHDVSTWQTLNQNTTLTL